MGGPWATHGLPNPWATYGTNDLYKTGRQPMGQHQKLMGDQWATHGTGLQTKGGDPMGNR